MTEKPDELERAFRDLHRHVDQQADSHGASVEEILARAGLADVRRDEAEEGRPLVRAAQAGDPEAFGELYDRYHDTVFRFVRLRLGDRVVAADLTQETFLRAYRRIGAVSDQGRDVGGWLVDLARELVLDHVRSDRYRLESATAEPADVPGIPGATRAEVLRCLAELPHQQRECLELRFFHGLSMEDTALIMYLSPRTVAVHQQRGIARLRRMLRAGDDARPGAGDP